MIPSTLKGPGWRPRTRTHVEELRAGSPWQNYGVDSHVGTLAAVLLAWPGDELAYAGDPADWLMAERPDLSEMRKQALNIAAYYEGEGAAVHWIRPTEPAPPNLVFACDLFFMTPQGAILSRMAAEQRAGEERLAAQALLAAGVPILGTPTGSATLEGADVMWVRPDVVLVGTGVRTNEEGFAFVHRILAEQGVRATAVSLHSSVQHLLGTVNLVDDNLCVTFDPSADLCAELDGLGIQRMEFEADVEVRSGRALNFVAVAPRHIVMPAGCPKTRDRLQKAGIRCDELPVDQYLRAEGALGCLTGILSRSSR